MGSRNKNTRNQDVQNAYQQDRSYYQQQANNYQPSELEKRMEADSLQWLDFVDGKNGPVDYTKAPGLVHTGMFDEAIANRYADRTATGGLQMGSAGANPTAVALRKQQIQDQMAERRGAGMVDAVRAKDAMVRGTTAPFLIGTGEDRMRAKLGSAASMAQSSAQAYASLPQQHPWWETLTASALGAAGNMFKFSYAL